MKLVIAPDKFKGSLTASAAGEIVRDAIAAERPHWTTVVKPLADGGDGTAEVLQVSLGGEWVTAAAMGPLPMIPSTGRYVWLPARRLAVIEMAVASGLVLVPPARRDPLKATTYGTGQLIADAIRRGATRVLLGIGGSATVDGGVGAAMALGWRFLDGAGQPLGLGGGELRRLARIERPATPGERRAAPSLPELDVLCDVDNPLVGEHGAARVFGPQKGATPAMVEALEAGLANLAAVVRRQFGREIAAVPGAGAAGGLAAGALAFLGARLVPGIETVIEVTELSRALADADWVITGEGRFDGQSLRGKVVSGVSRLARKNGIRVAVLAGQVALTPAEYSGMGIDRAFACQREGLTLEYSLAHARELLAAATRELIGSISEPAR